MYMAACSSVFFRPVHDFYSVPGNAVPPFKLAATRMWINNLSCIRTTIQPYIIIEQNGHQQNKWHDIHRFMCTWFEY